MIPPLPAEVLAFLLALPNDAPEAVKNDLAARVARGCGLALFVALSGVPRSGVRPWWTELAQNDVA